VTGAPRHPWWRGFAFAATGLRLAWRSERNLRVQCAAGWAALAAAWLCGLSAARVAVLLALVGAVLGAEILNTAVEAAVDLAAPGWRPLAGRAKDLAAGGVLSVSLGALAAGLAVFWPHWLHPRATLAAWASRPWLAAAGAVGEAALVGLACAPVAPRAEEGRP
jgi:diacylglycerol kinase